MPARTTGKKLGRAVGVLTAASLLGAGIVASPTASAGVIIAYRTTVTTSGNCASQGAFTAKAVSGGCYLSDNTDGTLFEWDSNGKAGKIEVRKSHSDRFKVEFHPYGEKVWVYDLRNDGDAVYVEVIYRGKSKIVQAPATGKAVDVGVKDFNFDEGVLVEIKVWDSWGYTGGQDLLNHMNVQG